MFTFFRLFVVFFSVHTFFNLCHLAELISKAFPIFFQEIHPKISMVANDHLKIFLVHSSFHFLFQRRKFLLIPFVFNRRQVLIPPAGL